MCGISAAVPADDEFTRYAVEAQRNRGPDGVATVNLGFCSLGINRLAISGLTGGAQPLSSNDGSVLVIFNGAIYNSQDLIERFNFQPASKNDGEVVHFLYERFGMRFADHLEGMFSICIADVRRRCVVFALDQVGIKPMYSCDLGGRLYVASVIQAFPPEMRSEVRRVPPGTVWSTSGQIERIAHAYYKDDTLPSLLAASVKEQIPLEVNWGCMLSGGLDSSLIARIASDLASEVHTFTCGTEQSADLLAAREVADILGTNHHETVVASDELPAIVDSVIESTASIESWTVMGGVGTYLTARSASGLGVKVLLSGEGADELFGGYDEFQSEPAPFLNSMLLQYQIDLGVTECLRLDRTTMAHGIEARVPYLSTSIMRYARALEPGDKIRTELGEAGRKYNLRRFAHKVLPAKIADRRKQAFTNGSGITVELIQLAGSMYPTSEIVKLRASFPSFPIVDPLSAWFFSRWLAIYGVSIGTDWYSLVDRGLFRQRPSRYLPVVRESAIYL